MPDDPRATVHPLDVSTSVSTCPVCGYRDGWHVSFVVEGNDTRIVLICPSCHFRFAPAPAWDITTNLVGRQFD